MGASRTSTMNKKEKKREVITQLTAAAAAVLNDRDSREK